MIVKIVTILLVAFVATSAGYDEWTDFVASWALNTTTHFYNIPQTETAAQKEGWTHINGIDEDNEVVALGYKGDPAFVVLYRNGIVIGVHLAFRVSDVANLGQPLDYASNSAITEKTINEEKFYTATAYIYKDTENSYNSRIELKQKEGYLVVPANKTRVLEETPFLFKGCTPSMGYHYYQLKNDTDCTTLNPWFLLSKGDNIIGLGFYGFGTPSSTGDREWYEEVPYTGLLSVVPDAPTCALDAIAEYGSIFLHMWFVSDPKSIDCS